MDDELGDLFEHLPPPSGALDGGCRISYRQFVSRTVDYLDSDLALDDVDGFVHLEDHAVDSGLFVGVAHPNLVGVAHPNSRHHGVVLAQLLDDSGLAAVFGLRGRRGRLTTLCAQTKCCSPAP